MRTLLLLIVLLVATCANATEEPIGRLFYTPQQRAQMDILRLRNGGQLSAYEVSQRITVNGLVQRSSGKDTAWVNRTARDAHNAITAGAIGNRGRAAPAVTIELPSGKNVNLKAGQSYDLNSGRVSEPYENRLAPQPAPSTPNAPNTQQK